LPPGLPDLLRTVGRAERPVVDTEASSAGGATAYRAALPIPRETGERQVLVVVGGARHPFTALDDAFLVALGRQLGSALDGAELNARLQGRTQELSRLSVRMIHQHEEERRRLSLELHDETAQVFSAVKLRLGVIGERTDEPTARSIAVVSDLVDQGMRSIRSVTEMLRPAALDDLGLEASLHSLALEFEQTAGLDVRLEVAGDTSIASPDAELVLFRALQEGLSNVVRHAGATRVDVALTVAGERLQLRIADNGMGTGRTLDLDELQRAGHTGLAGIRERVQALAGEVSLRRSNAGGIELLITLPVGAAGERR
jgi:signal transduction histidine kinase